MTRASEGGLRALALIADLRKECVDEAKALQRRLDEQARHEKVRTTTLADRNAERLARLTVMVEALAKTCIEEFDGEVDDV